MCAYTPLIAHVHVLHTHTFQDVNALESLVEEDLEAGRMPVMVIAYAGTPMAGHIEDMAAIRTVCNKHKIWMHVHG